MQLASRAVTTVSSNNAFTHCPSCLQLRKTKGMKKCDKIVLDSQERAFWRVHRPPPGFLNSLEYVPVPNRNRSSKPKKRTLEDVQREVTIG